MLLQRATDRRLGLMAAVAAALVDPRRRANCEHDVGGLLRQLLHAIALGYENLDDHEELRQDVAMQTVVDLDQVLASAHRLCASSRTERNVRRPGGRMKYCWSNLSAHLNVRQRN